MRKALLFLLVALAGCGGSGGSGQRGPDRVDLILDFFPNADHAPIYAAPFKKEGLDVRIHAPSDPSAPLKLLAADKADLAVSYEPEVLRAREKGLPVVAVAALVRVPLTSIVSLPSAGINKPADLRGKTVGTAGIDYQSAYLKTIAPPGYKERNVGFDLVPALVSGKVDAVLGAYWNYEAIQLRQKGRNPRVIRIEQAGVPTYDELVIAARVSDVNGHPDRLRRFLKALGEGADSLKAQPGRAADALLAANKDLDPQLQRASIQATLPYFLPKPGTPYGYMNPAEWRLFTGFMESAGLLKPTDASAAFTNALLP